jgi:uncharacterized damage-inducible protein DinB
MDMPEHYRRLFAYDDWANREVLAALKSAEPCPPRAVEFLAHILATQRLWWERLNAVPQSIPVWPPWSVAQCEEQCRLTPELWKEYLPAARFESQVRYKNTKGEEFSSTVADILMHVVAHGAYHRGQVATAMRSSGHTPPYTDFIHGIRQGLVR